MSEANIEQIIKGQATSDGAGVRLNRIIGTAQLRHRDPFLMLDEFKSDQPGDYIAGFPAHPHRGFETVTYLLAGAMEHGDHMGNKGTLLPGSVQWMTAGRGVIHSEMPKQVDGLLWGFQLWVNLPASRKLCDAAYQEYSAEQIPRVMDNQGIERRVIAGDSLGTQGVISAPETQPLYVDIRMPAGTQLTHPLPAGCAAMVYVFEGKVTVAGQELVASQLATLSAGDSIDLRAEEQASLLLISGQPLAEPIVQHGPFVMNTVEEIHQAIHDYQSGQLTG